MRIVLAWPSAPPRICPRGVLGGAALGEMKTSAVNTSGDENVPKPAEYQIRMRRTPGGRSRVIYVRVTEDEDREIRRRAMMQRRSAPRFLIESALSGSARVSAERSRAQRDAEMTRIGLARLANNVNQLAKWANTNQAMPAKFFDLIDDLDRAVESVEQTIVGLGRAWAAATSRIR
jgi:uncharacterized protein (DUF1778 family)